MSSDSPALKIKITSSYQDIVLGSSLASLLIAQTLHDAGRKVLLISSEPSLGGELRSLPTEQGPIASQFEFVPYVDELPNILHHLSEDLQLEVHGQSYEPSFLTFDGGHLKTFLGFGSEPPPALDVVTRFIRPSHFVHIRPSFDEILSNLIQRTSYERALGDHVTRIEQVEGGFHVEVNGTKIFKAEKVIATEHPRKLLDWVPPGVLPTRLLQKISKQNFWTSIDLTFLHTKPQTDYHGLHLLMGAKREPTLGGFHRIAPEGHQVSHWTTFIPWDLTDDHEAVGQALREAKKQIKRAYPEALNDLATEKIIIQPGNRFSAQIDLDKQELKKWPGFYLASPHLEKIYGPGAELLTAEVHRSERSTHESSLVRAARETQSFAPHDSQL